MAALLSLLLAFIAAPHIAAALSCALYESESCVFGKEVVFDNDACQPQNCSFNAKQDFYERCALSESGVYRYVPAGAAGCADPFLSTLRAPPAPCGARCCRADHAGDFSSGGGTLPGNGAPRLEWQPSDAECRFAEITRGQVLRFLRSRGADVVVIGDSMMRQLHLRLVALMRGQARLLDHHLHSHSQYFVCGEADALRIAAPSPLANVTAEDNAYLQASLVPFLRVEAGPGAAAARAAVARCSRRPVHVPFIWAPRFATQGPSFEKYFEAALPGSKPVVVTSVGYWESRAPRPSPSYIAALSNLRGRAHKVVVVGVPTGRETRADRAANYFARNSFMRQWVAAQGEPYLFVDYDALSRAAHPPPGGADANLHYMCAAYRALTGGGVPLEMDRSAGGDGAAQIPRGDVRFVRANEDGLCADEMNRNLWQVILNAVVQPEAGAGQTA